VISVKARTELHERQMVKELKGVFPILATPCDEKGDLDLESLGDEVEYCLENGVHGFFLGNCSELYAFSRADRNRIVEAVVEASSGRVPVVAGCFASNTGDAVELSRDAEERGADAIFTYGPYVLGGGSTPSVDIVEHYRRVDAAVDIPIVGYNTPQGMPGVMTPERLFEILDACPGMEYMKTGETEAHSREVPDELPVHRGLPQGGRDVGVHSVGPPRRARRDVAPLPKGRRRRGEGHVDQEDFTLRGVE
jgi:4-hydroxy-tetrahydrodipicolinate synthase